MRAGLILLVALDLLQASASPPSIPLLCHLRYMRPVAAKGVGEVCAVLDADVFAHAAPSLKDLRLFTSTQEVPYVITLSETADLTDETASLVDVHSDPGLTAFDLRMPARPYTDVDLDLRQQNFVVTATVSGSNDLASPARTPLGVFTLFDLSSRHLSRDTVLPLQENAFRYLHIELRGDPIARDAILGAQIPPSRQAQTLYTTVGQTSILSREGDETVASLRIPAHVPLERVSIQLAPGFTGNFDRPVHVTGRADGPDAPVETIDGNITRVHLGKVQQEQLVFDAAMGVNLQSAATLRIAIQDSREAPLPVSSVKLKMRRRSICFAMPPTAPTLFYGDSTLAAAHYGTSLPSSQARLLPADLGPEALNPAFVERAQTAPVRWRLDLLWLLLLAGFGGAGTILLHTLRRRFSHHG